MNILKIIIGLVTLQWFADSGCSLGGCFRLIMTIGVLLLCGLLLL